MCTWSASQYRAAADKHYKVCILLRNEYEGNKDKKCLVSNLFYLGGYVIECTLKYLILCNKPERDKSYSREELASMLLWTHNLKELLRLATEQVEGFTISWYALNQNTRKWNESVRYDVPIKNQFHQCIRNDFWTDVNEIYNIMRENY